MEIVEGDTWAFTIRNYDPIPGTNPPQPNLSAPTDLTDFVNGAQLQVREAPGHPPVLSLSAPDNGLTVTTGTGPDGGQIIVYVPSTGMTAVVAGLWEWSCAVDDGNGNRRTVVASESLAVSPRLIQ
jgi:hypothetical protein